MNIYQQGSGMAKAPQETTSGRVEFQNQDGILLGVLSAVERDSAISQRAISRELGVALGLANAYLKRCVRKGLIKIQQVPRRRYAYYLTPQGFAEKTRLTGQYLAFSLTFFRRAREQMANLLAECVEKGWRNIVLAGVSDLAEVATICAPDYPIKIVAIVDPERAGEQFCNTTVLAGFDKSVPVDAVIVTSLLAPDETYRHMVAEVGAERVLAPRVLRIIRPTEAAPNRQELVAE
jgi:DNA-binding MarR family transcriptional regulator